MMYSIIGRFVAWAGGRYGVVYTVIGRLIVLASSKFLKRKASANRAKLGAGAVVVAVLIAGIAAARGDDDG